MIEVFTMKKIDVDGNSYECNVDPSQMPIIERMLRGTTGMDDEIQALSIPDHPLTLRIIVITIRWYRQSISPRLGNRCVFEPSCSHYAELAFRKKGLYHGLTMTIKRLYRCRPENGGVDLP